jgi:hypothetical protein
MGLVYDYMKLTQVTTVGLRVTGVLQMVSEPTIAISRTRTGQLRKIR